MHQGCHINKEEMLLIIALFPNTTLVATILRMLHYQKKTTQFFFLEMY